MQICWLWRWVKKARGKEWVALRFWKRQGNRFFLRASRSDWDPDNTLALTQWDWLDFYSTELEDNNFVLFETWTVVICYVSDRKLMHHFS